MQRRRRGRSNTALAVVPTRILPAVRVLSRVFRGKYLALLRKSLAQGRLSGWPDPQPFEAWLTSLSAKDWVVYAKPPFGGPERVLK